MDYAGRGREGPGALSRVISLLHFYVHGPQPQSYLESYLLRELLIKKMQLYYGLLPKGGGVPRQSKSFGTLFV